MDIVAEIPLASAGHTECIIQHDEEDWVERLFELLLKRNPQSATTLLKGRTSTKEQFIGFVIKYGTGVGGAVGGAVGVLGGPRVASLGVAIGSAIGAGLVALAGTTDAAATVQDKSKVEKQKQILKAELSKDKKQE